MFHTRPVPCAPADAESALKTFMWDKKFVVPIRLLRENTRLVCTLWLVDIPDDPDAPDALQTAQVAVTPVRRLYGC